MKKRLLAVLLLLALAVALGACMTSCGEDDEDAKTYFTEDLSKYVTIKQENYRGMTLQILWDEVTEADVEEWIRARLVAHRAEQPSYDGAGQTDIPITLGDEVYIYYDGYELKEDGTRVPFEGGNNFASGSTKIVVGQGGFISGFEGALLGRVPQDMVKLKTRGALTDGDYVTMTYFAVYPDGSYGNKSDTFLFSASEEAEIDAVYGEGFYDAVVDYGAEYGIGQSNEKAYISAATFPLNGGEVQYMDIVFAYGADRADQPLVAETYFPADYSEESLRGQTRYFDIYLDYTKNYVIAYDTPELNETFLVTKEKEDVTALEAYEGATLVEKYRNKVRATLQGDALVRQVTYRDRLTEALVSALAKKATIHDYPDWAIKEQTDMMEAWLDECVAYYVQNGYQEDREAIAKMEFGYTSGTYTDYFNELAKTTVAEIMPFYQMAKQEGWLLEGDALEAAVEEAKQELFALSLSQNKEEFAREKYDSDASYQAALDGFYEEMLTFYRENYGEGYFAEYAQDRAIASHIGDVFDIRVIGRKD